MSVVIVTLFIIHVDIIRFLFFISNETMRCGSLMILKMAAKLMKNQGLLGFGRVYQYAIRKFLKGFCYNTAVNLNRHAL